MATGLPLAERLTTINAHYTAQLAKAKRYPPVGVRRSTGRRRDAMIARAEREYYESLRRLGIRTRRRLVAKRG